MDGKIFSKSNIFHQCRGCSNMYNTQKKAEECYNSHLVKRCISCLREFETDEDSIIFDHYNGCSLHVKDTCGYGSEHDMTTVDFVVCTECMNKFLGVWNKFPESLAKINTSLKKKIKKGNKND